MLLLVVEFTLGTFRKSESLLPCVSEMGFNNRCSAWSTISIEPYTFVTPNEYFFTGVIELLSELDDPSCKNRKER